MRGSMALFLAVTWNCDREKDHASPTIPSIPANHDLRFRSPKWSTLNSLSI